MKKDKLAIAGFILMIGFSACSDSGNRDATTTDSSSATTTTNNNAATNSTTSNTTSTTSGTPLSKQDSAFAMKATIGGLMEVGAGNIAQQNAANSRVKAFGMMMVNDHQKANSELMALTAGRGMTLPTTLPPDMQNHMEEMRKMQGKAFDNHYMNMMVNDHQKTIADFQTQANNGSDPELKAWAAKTLPVLQMHRDSATAINKGIK